MYFQNKSATISLNEYHIKFNDAAVFQFSFRFLYTPTLFVLAQDARDADEHEEGNWER